MHSHLDTFDVGRVEGLPSEPYGHQDDHGLPGLAGRVGAALAQRRLAQSHHVLLIHCKADNHHDYVQFMS